MTSRIAIITAISAIATATQVFAEPIEILNPSFEADGLAENGKQWQFNMSDWSGYRLGIMAPSEGQFANNVAIDGEQVAFLSFAESWMAQDLAAAFQPNMSYTLSLQVGLRQDSNFGRGGDYALALAAGDTVLAESQARAPLPGQFKTVSLNYITGAADASIGSPIRIKLTNLSARQINFDQVSLSAIPIEDVPPSEITPPVWETVGLWTYDEVDGLRLADGLTLIAQSGAGIGHNWSHHIELKSHDTLPVRQRILWPVSLNRKDKRVCVDAPYPSFSAHMDLPGDADDGTYSFGTCKGGFD